jgi:cobalt-zinc-cadmium efflux system outer membrane protein
MSALLLKTLGVACVAAVAGCATVPKDADFGAVQNRVAERTGQRIQWTRGSNDDISRAVDLLLSRPLSADDAVQISLLNNRNLQATYEDLGIAQAELVSAGLLKNPTLTAEVRFPKDPQLPFDIDITQSFLDLFFIPIRKRIATAQFDAAKWRVTNEVVNTAAEAKSAFYRAQAAEQLLDLRRTVLKATAASSDAARRLHEAGNITDRAFATEQAANEQAKIDLSRAEADALDAREALNAVMGAWGSQTNWNLSPRLPELPQAEVDPQGLESLAVKQRADLGAARDEVVALAQSAGLANSSALFSEASATVHWSGEPDGTRSIGPGLEIPLPIFNQGQPAIAAAQARFRRGQQRYFALAVQVRADVRRARNRMLAVRAQAEQQMKIVIPLRHQIVEQSQLEYNAMRIGVFELLQSKQSEIDAGRDYVESLRDYWLARTDLEKAMGGRLPLTGPTTQRTPLPATAPTTIPNQHQHQHGH